MSYQQYERVPLVENGVPLHQLDPSYFTGIPNTAPPSFRSIASANRHRNTSFSQSTTAQENDDGSEDPGISLWGGSSMDAESVRENTMMMLINRVESLENRLEQQQHQQQQQQPLADKEEVDLEAQAQKKRKDFWIFVGVSIAVSIFSLWFMAVILLSVWAKVEFARNKSIGQLNNNGL